MSGQDISVREMANALRALAMDAVEAAQSGHPGMPMGMADVATVLFKNHLRFDSAAPDWPDRDRLVLSAGHGSMLLYGLLHLTGYEGMPLEALKNFRQLHSPAAGHPEYGEAPGIETTTGPLGQGVANAVGMAIAESALRARFGDKLVDHRTWVIAGDGCLMEGVSQEAITLAGHLKLNRLIVIWDDNNISIDGPLSLTDSTNQRARFEASGWATFEVDGHDPDAVDAVLAKAAASDRPVLIAARTIIGFGADKKAGTSAAHGAPLGAEEIAAARETLNWPYAPFDFPEAIAQAWRATAERGATARAAWSERFNALPAPERIAFARDMAGEVKTEIIAALSDHAAKLAADKPAMATRAASGAAIAAFHDLAPSVMGGSADLTGSNNTIVKGEPIFSADNPSGRYIHYGVREHAMAAAMNGMALHGGVIPFGGTFLVFSDYNRPSIRLAALMGVRVIHVGTHDSIGLGEDGPTHQPVEHLAALRAIPNLCVFRPCDAVETAECWSLALQRADGPSLLALSRQKTPGLRDDASSNLSANGAYELATAEGGPAQATIFATGTEVALAMNARESLQKAGAPTRVVSAPCLELFAALPAADREAIIGDAPVRVAIEAGVRQGWDMLLRPQDGFIGMTGFGASAPASALYPHFGITADAVVNAVRERLAEAVQRA